MLFLITSASPETFQNILVLLATEENGPVMIKIKPEDLRQSNRFSKIEKILFPFLPFSTLQVNLFSSD